ncbi:MAG: hypothetical protein HFE86_06480 [Clostridiales bacterium]|nr:hypothetical protein [Clostridiales bacterium]
MAYSSKRARRRPPQRNKKRDTVFILFLMLVLTAAVVILLTMNRSEENKTPDISDSDALTAPSSTATAPSAEPSDRSESFSSASDTSTPSSAASADSTGRPAETTSEPKASSQNPASTSSKSQTGAQAIPYDPGDWALKLVNFQTPLENGFDPDLSKIKSAYNPNSLKIDSRIVEAVDIMCDAAKKDGVTLTVISAYRTNAKQNSLYNNKVDRLVAQGYNRDEALTVAATAVARPGTSEHQLGLAIDFNSVEQDFEHTKAGKWLRAHCVEYGFVIRYPDDKKELTGVIYEPWHFRFVGRKNAAKMQELDMCLEEYLAYLGK